MSSLLKGVALESNLSRSLKVIEDNACDDDLLLLEFKQTLNSRSWTAKIYTTFSSNPK